MVVGGLAGGQRLMLVNGAEGRRLLAVRPAAVVASGGPAATSPALVTRIGNISVLNGGAHNGTTAIRPSFAIPVSLASNPALVSLPTSPLPVNSIMDKVIFRSLF